MPPVVGPAGAVARRHRPDLLPPAALRALSGATAWQADVVPASGPGSQVAGTGRGGGFPGQRVHRERRSHGERRGRSAEEIKQDCELKALAPAAAAHQEEPIRNCRFVLGLDNLYACGTAVRAGRAVGLVVCGDLQGRPHAGLVAGIPGAAAGRVPRTCCKRTWGDRQVQEFRWVPQLRYEDSERPFLEAQCLGMHGDDGGGAGTYFAWLTTLPVSRQDGGGNRPERRA